MCNATWPMISQSRGFCFAPCDQVHPSICRVSPSILMQSGTLHMHAHEILVYCNSCGGVRVGLCVSGLFVYVSLLRLKKSGLMQRLFHDLRISHNAPWARQIPGICPITLWPLDWSGAQMNLAILCVGACLQSMTVNSITPTWINDIAVNQYGNS